MISYWWSLALLPILGLFLFILLRKRTKRNSDSLSYRKYVEFYDAVNSSSGRFGLITTYDGSIEFREVVTSSGEGKNGKEEWLKISIIKVYPNLEKTEKDVLEEIKYNGWIKISKYTDYVITWFDDNSQRVRDEKISEILEKN